MYAILLHVGITVVYLLLILLSAGTGVPRELKKEEGYRQPFYRMAAWLLGLPGLKGKGGATGEVRKNLAQLNPGADIHVLVKGFEVKRLGGSLMFLFAGNMISLLICISAVSKNPILGENGIERNEYGDSAKNLQVDIYADDEPLLENEELKVGALEYTDEEAVQLFNTLKDSLESLVLGENESAQYVCSDLVFPSGVEGYPFSIEWELKDYSVMDGDGHLKADKISPEGSLQTITAKLSYRTMYFEHSFNVVLYPPPLSEEGNEVELENPVENVESESSAVMDLFFGETEISGKSMDTGNLYSNREPAAGCGIVANTEDLDSIKNGLLFDLYLVDKFPNYTAPGEKADLAYELEYIICGKDNDKDNIQSVAAQLFAVRYAANAMLILTDETLIAQAEAAAVAVALVTLCPEVKEPLTQAILYAWAFAESCVDIRTLLDGGKVPLIKSAESLVIDSVPKVLGYKLYLDEGKSVETGFSYMNYLQLLMLPVSGEKKLTRSIDLIENRLRNMQGYENFKMDNCIEYLEAEVKIKSGFGREYQVKRSFGYMGMPKVSY